MFGIFFNRKCRHKYPNFVDEDGYQFCMICGEAIKITIPHIHNWELVSTHQMYDTGKTEAKGDYPMYCERVYECTDSSCREIRKQQA